MYIYKITCIPTGKVYVGQTRRHYEVRWSRHRWDLNNNKHHNAHMQNAWNKHGEEMFQFEVIEQCGDFSTLNQQERYWIKEYNLCLFNLTEGGKGTRGAVVSPETRAKIGAAHRGKVVSPETRAKIGAAGVGRTHSPEARAKISAAGVGRIFSEETRAKMSLSIKGKNKGKVHSAETRKKLSVVHRGRTHSPEARAKIGAAHIGKVVSSETTEKIAATRAANRRIKMQHNRVTNVNLYANIYADSSFDWDSDLL